MEIGLLFIGSCTVMCAIILLVKNFIKKESKKRSIIIIVISFFMVGVGGIWGTSMMTPEQTMSST